MSLKAPKLWNRGSRWALEASTLKVYAFLVSKSSGYKKNRKEYSSTYFATTVYLHIIVSWSKVCHRSCFNLLSLECSSVCAKSTWRSAVTEHEHQCRQQACPHFIFVIVTFSRMSNCYQMSTSASFYPANFSIQVIWMFTLSFKTHSNRIVLSCLKRRKGTCENTLRYDITGDDHTYFSCLNGSQQHNGTYSIRDTQRVLPRVMSCPLSVNKSSYRYWVQQDYIPSTRVLQTTAQGFMFYLLKPLTYQPRVN